MESQQSATPQRPIEGPLAQLLKAVTRKSGPRPKPEPRKIKPSGASRTHFLAELEIIGDCAAACQTAGCSLAEVRAWRQSDPMFERDYRLALVGHLKALRRMVQEIADRHESPQVRQAAQQLLSSESSHAGSDGRLDARSWRDALASFAHSLGIDLAWWEPAGEDEPSPPPRPQSDSSAA